MILYPAIDLMGNRSVRLRQGRRDEVTDHGDPVEIAKAYKDAGAQWLHLVDLEAAFEGVSTQGPTIAKVVKAFGGRVQLGGGNRSMEVLKERFECTGISRCILGTAALENPELVLVACEAYPGQIACGIDANKGMVATRGWVRESNVTALSLAQDMEKAGVCAVIYTDIAKDGMMAGPNVQETDNLARRLTIPVIASGGVASLADIKALQGAGCGGAIIGKALYSGAFTLAEALEMVS